MMRIRVWCVAAALFFYCMLVLQTFAASPVIAEGLPRICFVYDKLSVPAVEMPKVQRVAALLKEHPELIVEIQGHTDERGSDDYNLMLGERMAQVVKNRLVDLGVVASRLKVISFGEEQPLDSGHDSDAWDKNRRVEFKIIEGAKGK